MALRHPELVRHQATVEVVVGVIAGKLAAVFGLVHHNATAATYLSVSIGLAVAGTELLRRNLAG
jgi:hypothetical protein